MAYLQYVNTDETACNIIDRTFSMVRLIILDHMDSEIIHASITNTEIFIYVFLVNIVRIYWPHSYTEENVSY